MAFFPSYKELSKALSMPLVAWLQVGTSQLEQFQIYQGTDPRLGLGLIQGPEWGGRQEGRAGRKEIASTGKG